MKLNNDLMIEMIRDYFEAKTTHSWQDYPIRIDRYQILADTTGVEKIFIWYYITISGNEALNYIAISKADYDFKINYREAATRDEKLDSLLKGSFFKRFF